MIRSSVFVCLCMPAVLRPVSSQDIHICLITSGIFTSQLLSNSSNYTTPSSPVSAALYRYSSLCKSSGCTMDSSSCAKVLRALRGGQPTLNAWTGARAGLTSCSLSLHRKHRQSPPLCASFRALLPVHPCHTNHYLLHSYQSTNKKKKTLLINSESVSYHRARPAHMSDDLDNSPTLLGFSYRRLEKGGECEIFRRVDILE